MYDFDELIVRDGTNCIKHDALHAQKGKELIPLWVADMDFKTPEFIVDALKERLGHPVFGYTALPEGYFELISRWVEDIHGWKTDPSHYSFIPGIVRGIGFVLECFCSPGDKVIIQPPVYHPFRNVPTGLGYEVVSNPLRPRYAEDGRLDGYDMDFEQLESIIDERTKVLVLSNPHNPAGIAWSADTLRKLAEITSRRGVMVISDEIHAEMVFGSQHGLTRHIPYASVSAEAASNSVTFMAPTKTFNIAGIVSSYAIVPDPALREKLFKYLEAIEIDFPTSLFSPIATIAAYTHGKQWRDEMLDYVQGNVDFVHDYIEENIPGMHALKPQASFLVWLDCRGLGLSQEQLADLFEQKAHLALNDGAMFGGPGYMRLNIGCPRSILRTALEQLRDAVRETTRKNK